jgi:hypothetical protein
MSLLDQKSPKPDGYPLPEQDEEPLALEVDWTPQEAAKAKRK